MEPLCSLSAPFLALGALHEQASKVSMPCTTAKSRIQSHVFHIHKAADPLDAKQTVLPEHASDSALASEYSFCPNGPLQVYQAICGAQI